MKRAVVRIPILACILMLCCAGCTPAERTKRDISQELPPVARAAQQIKTPTLQPRETAPSRDLPGAAETAAAADTATKAPQPEAPHEVIPGLPLTTPPIPGQLGDVETETPLPPVPPPGAEPGSAAAVAEPTAPQPFAAVAGLPTPTPPSAAPPREEIAFEPTVVAGATSIIMVLDASGSMAAPFSTTGDTKFDIARRAIEDILLGASEQRDIARNIAVRIFGASSPVAAGDCTDSQLSVPLGTFDLARIAGALRAITPQGTSPLSLALERSIDDLAPATTGDRVVVLIADGGDTCGGNPCATAQRLRNAGIIAQVIGFDLAAEDQEQLTCIASVTDGAFHLARNEAELRRAIDEALNANVPYNLRLVITAGAAPLPTEISIIDARTSKVLRKEPAFGTKVFKLPTGTYDILVEFSDSPEKRKPSKLIKGVAVLETTRVEQTVNFDLGQLSIEAIDDDNNLIPAAFRIMKSGTTAPLVEIESGAQRTSFMLTADTYDIVGTQIGAAAERLTIVQENVAIETGVTTTAVLRFQKGTIALKAETTRNQPMPFIYQVYTAGSSDALVASGAVTAAGSTINLSPGVYDMIATGQDPGLPADPRTKISNIAIRAGERADLTVLFEMGELILSAVDNTNVSIPARFVVRDADTDMEIASIASDAKQPATLPIPPGAYVVTAYSTRSAIEPQPSVQISDVQVSAQDPVAKVARFILGTIRVRGTDAKESPVKTQFSIHEAGSDDIVAMSMPTDQWVLFEVPPGRYDVKAVNVAATSPEKPHIVLKDIVLKEAQTISHLAIFTAGQIKIIGRGPNNKIIMVSFKIFEYGADTELINGRTGDDWARFEIPPGRYYLEAAWVDPVKDVLLKKWVNVTVGENETVEQILRF